MSTTGGIVVVAMVLVDGAPVVLFMELVIDVALGSCVIVVAVVGVAADVVVVGVVAGGGGGTTPMGAHADGAVRSFTFVHYNRTNREGEMKLEFYRLK